MTRFESSHVRPGDPLTASWANALIEAVAAARTQLVNLSAAPPLTISRDSGGMRLALAGQSRLEIFELDEALMQGGTAAATVVRFDGSDWITNAEQFEVHDVLGSFHAPEGNRGLALFHQQSGLWVVLQLEC